MLTAFWLDYFWPVGFQTYPKRAVTKSSPAKKISDETGGEGEILLPKNLLAASEAVVAKATTTKTTSI